MSIAEGGQFYSVDESHQQQRILYFGAGLLECTASEREGHWNCAQPNRPRRICPPADNSSAPEEGRSAPSHFAGSRGGDFMLTAPACPVAGPGKNIACGGNSAGGPGPSRRIVEVGAARRVASQIPDGLTSAGKGALRSVLLIDTVTTCSTREAAYRLPVEAKKHACCVASCCSGSERFMSG